MNMFKKNGGFTLVELIVVIAILAILAGVAVPAYTGYINRANEAADITALDAIKTACMAATAEKGSVSQITVTAGGTNGAVTKVVATVLSQFKGKKQLVFKFKKRKNYKKLRGHRQNLSLLFPFFLPPYKYPRQDRFLFLL